VPLLRLFPLAVCRSLSRLLVEQVTTLNLFSKSRPVQMSTLIGGLFLAVLIGSFAIRYLHLLFVGPILISLWLICAVWFLFTAPRT
jgi:hypothetical protein